MCAEFEQHRSAVAAWARLLGDWRVPDGPVRLHVWPRREALTIDAEGVHQRHWSLVPHWAREATLKFSTFNARAETVRDKPVFRDAWRRGQRCVVPASTWYEWSGPAGRRSRWQITPPDPKGVLFAGLWDRWSRGEAPLDSFTVITVPAAPALRAVHARMPLLLTAEQAELWLHAPAQDAARLLATPASLPELATAPAPRAPGGSGD